MSEKTASGKAESKPVIAKNELSKPSTASHDASTAPAEKNQKKSTVFLEKARRKQMHPNLHHKHLRAIFQAFPRPSIVLAGIKFLENQN